VTHLRKIMLEELQRQSLLKGYHTIFRSVAFSNVGSPVPPAATWAVVGYIFSALVDLRRQTDAAKQVLEARIGTEAVECRVHFEK
jgi:hypothetical protein